MTDQPKSRAEVIAAIAALASVAFATGASAGPPIWESYPHLNCRGEIVAMCSAETKACSATSSKASFSINFEGHTVTYRTGDGEEVERIIAQNRLSDSGVVISDAISLSSNRLIRFYPVADGAAPIRALMVGTTFSFNADVTTLTCTAH